MCVWSGVGGGGGGQWVEVSVHIFIGDYVCVGADVVMLICAWMGEGGGGGAGQGAMQAGKRDSKFAILRHSAWKGKTASETLVLHP